MVAALEPRGAVRLAYGFNSIDFLEKPVAIHGLILAAISPAPSVSHCFAKIGLSFAKICMFRAPLVAIGDPGLGKKLIAKISLEFTKSRVVD